MNVGDRMESISLASLECSEQSDVSSFDFGWTEYL